jgi:hypothetical protein
MTLSIKVLFPTLRISDTQHKCLSALYQVQLCILFKYSYAECYYAACHYVDFSYAECHYAECHYAECHYAECYAECHYALCTYAVRHYAECSYVECCVVKFGHNKCLSLKKQ